MWLLEFAVNAAVGLLTGIITGFGIGGGTLLVIYLTMFGNTEQLAAQGINLLYVLPTAASALVSHIKNKLIKWKIVLWAGCAGSISAIGASIAAAHADMGFLRRIFGGFLIIVGVSEFFRKNKKGERSEDGRSQK